MVPEGSGFPRQSPFPRKREPNSRPLISVPWQSKSHRHQLGSRVRGNDDGFAILMFKFLRHAGSGGRLVARNHLRNLVEDDEAALLEVFEPAVRCGLYFGLDPVNLAVHLVVLFGNALVVARASLLPREVVERGVTGHPRFL